MCGDFGSRYASLFCLLKSNLIVVITNKNVEGGFYALIKRVYKILFWTYFMASGDFVWLSAEAAETQLSSRVNRKCAVDSDSLIRGDYHFLFQFLFN